MLQWAERAYLGGGAAEEMFNAPSLTGSHNRYAGEAAPSGLGGVTPSR
jgi:hypothetical protein